MTDSPEKQSKQSPTPEHEADAAMARVRDELQKAQQQDKSKSLLRSAIDLVAEPYTRSGHNLSVLQGLAHDGTGKDFEEKANRAVVAEENAQQRERDSYSIIDGALRSFGNFAPKKLGYAISGAVSALDEVKPHESQNYVADAALGLTKGIFERRLTASLGKRDINPTTMALGMGVGNRFIETALSQTNLVDKAGDVTPMSMASGLWQGAKAAFSPDAMKGDLAGAAIAYPFTKGLQSTFAANSFRRAASTAFVYGYSQGLVEEVQSSKNGNPFENKDGLAHLAFYPLARGVASSIGAMPGGERQYVKEWAWENSVKSRNREYQMVSIAPEDVSAINSARGKPVDVNVGAVNPLDMTIQPATSVAIGRQSVPTDWISRAVDAVTFKSSRESNEPQLRFMSRDTTKPDAPWEMVTARGFKTLAEAAKQDPYYAYHRSTTVDKLIPNLKEPLVGLLGQGAESLAFQTAAGPVLKTSGISTYGKDFTTWGKLPFDSVTLSEQYHISPIGENSRGRYRSEGKALYLQEFVKMNGTQEQAAKLRDDMSDQHVDFSDFNYHLQGEQVSWATDQFGFRRIADPPKGQPAKIEPVMVDYGARRLFFNYEMGPGGELVKRDFDKKPADKPDEK